MPDSSLLQNGLFRQHMGMVIGQNFVIFILVKIAEEMTKLGPA